MYTFLSILLGYDWTFCRAIAEPFASLQLLAFMYMAYRVEQRCQIYIIDCMMAWKDQEYKMQSIWKSQILEHQYWTTLEHVCVSVSGNTRISGVSQSTYKTGKLGGHLHIHAYLKHINTIQFLQNWCVKCFSMVLQYLGPSCAMFAFFL